MCHSNKPASQSACNRMLKLKTSEWLQTRSGSSNQFSEVLNSTLLFYCWKEDLSASHMLSQLGIQTHTYTGENPVIMWQTWPLCQWRFWISENKQRKRHYQHILKSEKKSHKLYSGKVYCIYFHCRSFTAQKMSTIKYCIFPQSNPGLTYWHIFWLCVIWEANIIGNTLCYSCILHVHWCHLLKRPGIVWQDIEKSWGWTFTTVKTSQVFWKELSESWYSCFSTPTGIKMLLL